VDGGSKVVQITGTHLQTERHIAESLTLIPERRKKSLILCVKIFLKEIYCEAGNTSVSFLSVLENHACYHAMSWPTDEKWLQAASKREPPVRLCVNVLIRTLVPWQKFFRFICDLVR
jgi:hypothetical protein